jgi:hypothetical protein
MQLLSELIVNKCGVFVVVVVGFCWGFFRGGGYLLYLFKISDEHIQ